jgi:histone H3/H4
MEAITMSDVTAAVESKPGKTEQTKAVIEARVREIIAKSSGFKISAEFFDALNSEIVNLIHKAEARCSDNGRGTLKSQDI